jgi:fido (protein-threonine AMPylation protein)
VPYPGSFRGDERWPELERWEIEVGVNKGLPAAHVHAAIGDFIHVLRYFLVGLDQLVPRDQKPGSRELEQIVRLAAWAHGEWVRIHPFTDGNGCIARAWARFVFARYPLPPVVDLGSSSRPTGYVEAAAHSMAERNHHSTVLLFTQLLARQLGID